MSFSCVDKGSFHQGDEQLFPTSRNSQCTAISACALAWKILRLEFSTAAIDTILITGDLIYCTLRDENLMGGNQYLCPDELPSNFVIRGQAVTVTENSFVHDALYPHAEQDMVDSIMSLSNVLECLMAGFRTLDQLYLFDPHPVDEFRKYDLDNNNNNLARLLQCESYSALASLLLSNAALDGSVRQFTVTRLIFVSPTLSANDPVQLNYSASAIKQITCETLPKEIEGNNLGPKSKIPAVISSTLTNTTKRKAIGRPKKIQRDRPKLLRTTRDEQMKEAKMRYVQRNPKVGLDELSRYLQQHPEVHREAVRRYSQHHPQVHRDAVRRFDELHLRSIGMQEAVHRYDTQNTNARRKRLQGFRRINPKLAELRHLPYSLARLIVAHGPMAHWKAPLFEEEEEKRKWCCGEGAYNVTNLPPLNAPFYSKRRFLDRARAYNDLFALCALEISGG
ncbi:hypothetical protein J6590_035892 [Homalodisca vitripennis]|nr:hypothetical protein J6590_035892 [Homalodisca vitripennis]